MQRAAPHLWPHLGPASGGQVSAQGPRERVPPLCTSEANLHVQQRGMMCGAGSRGGKAKRSTLPLAKSSGRRLKLRRKNRAPDKRSSRRLAIGAEFSALVPPCSGTPPLPTPCCEGHGRRGRGSMQAAAGIKAHPGPPEADSSEGCFARVTKEDRRSPRPPRHMTWRARQRLPPITALCCPATSSVHQREILLPRCAICSAANRHCAPPRQPPVPRFGCAAGQRSRHT